MQLLYWPVIVLSVAVASVVSESQVGGLRARTVVPSPTPDSIMSHVVTMSGRPLTVLYLQYHCHHVRWGICTPRIC